MPSVKQQHHPHRPVAQHARIALAPQRRLPLGLLQGLDQQGVWFARSRISPVRCASFCAMCALPSRAALTSRVYPVWRVINTTKTTASSTVEAERSCGSWRCVSPAD